MGSLAISKPSPFGLFVFSWFFLASSLNVDDRNGDDYIISHFHYSAAIPSPTPPPPPPPRNLSPFKPSVAVIVGVLTTMFSITFLLLLYAKHCKRSGDGGGGYPRSNDAAVASSSAAGARKNSGIDRSVIESLPVFRFGSLRGQKDGLECAVCLTRFDPAEVLRLLPKCKHAFHVECVDTWLEAHSTCPLCRYRVDPEDVLLVGEPYASLDAPATWRGSAEEDEEKHSIVVDIGEEAGDGNLLETRRVSGRHSDGERGGRHKRQGGDAAAGTSRRSVDSARGARKKSETVTVGCFDRGPRKDALLLTEDEDGTAAVRQRTSAEERRRLEHRIIVSAKPSHQRWSDVQPSEMLYLRSEMLISDSRRFPSGGRGSSGKEEAGEGGRSVISGRSVSEITGMSRFSNNNGGIHINHERQRQRQVETDKATGLVSRWLAWISQSPAA